MQVIPKDKVIFHFNQTNPCVYTVQDGETFWVETDDCYSGQISSAKVLRPQIDISIMDASVGPIAVAGASPGDVLCVEILDIQFAPQGVMVTSPGLGVLGKKITQPNTKIIPIRDGVAHFSPEIELPLTPMVGVLGVAPKEGDIHCAVPGDHGANMDTKMVKKGAKVFLPVAVEGAGLAVGDLHACMGDGELSGTGIETAGKVLLKTTVIKQDFTRRPVIETDEGIYILASHEDIHEAVLVAVDEAAGFLMNKKSLDFPDAYRLVSATCDIQISQLVNDRLTVRIRIPKVDLGINSVV